MVLKFDPPKELVDAYLNRPNPGLEVVNSAQQAMQMYAQQKALQQQKDLTQEQRDIELAKGVSAGGQDFQSALDKIKAGRQAPQTMPTGQGPSLIDRAKAFFGAAPVGKNPSLDQGTPTPPIASTGTVSGQPSTVSPTTDPLVQEYQKDPLAFKTQHGTQGMDKLKTQVEIDKALQEKKPKGPEGYYDASGNKKFELPPDSHLLPAADLNLGTKESQQQDKLEEQYRKSFQQIRGDPALKRTEEQRDAAAIVYNRIKEVKDHGQVLNPIDYVDSLGQIYKARTGAAPTNEVLQQARQETLKGKYGKAYTLFTGQQAPATTEDIMNSLQDMALSMGNQADKFHDGYMRSRMRPPKGLAHDRVENVHAERGMSFAEATGQDQGSALPVVGGTFQGGKVLAIREVTKKKP